MKWSCRICRLIPDWPNLQYQGLEKWHNRPQPERNPDKTPRVRNAKSKLGGHWDPEAAEEIGPDM
eukprot:10894790-Alexandrium_andersonii.AAC.1